jgi:hypothetical protein
MDEISFNIFFILYILVISYFFPSYKSSHYISFDINNNLQRNKKKQIFIECGGGYVSYYVGIIKFIKDNYSKEDLEKIIWLASSAGVFAAINGAYIDKDKDESIDIFKKMLREMRQTWYGVIYNLNSLIKKYLYDKYLLQYKKDIECKNNKLFIAVLNVNIICPIFSSITFYYNFESMKEFTESCLCSHGIPFITGPLNVTIMTHPKKWYIKRMDAGWLTLLFGYLFGYDKFMPYGNNIEYHVISANIFRPLRIDWFWLWPYVKNFENLYNIGYEDAKNNVEILNKIIL